MLEIYTIYENPSDYPGKFVTRKFLVTTVVQPEKNVLIVADTLEEARSVIPQDLNRMLRQPDDDRVIVESWF